MALFEIHQRFKGHFLNELRVSFNKPMLHNVNRLNHSSLLNNTVTNKIKNFHRLFALGPEIPLKLKCHHHNQP